MKRIFRLLFIVIIFFLVFSTNVFAAPNIVVLNDNDSTYVPTNIVNGGFDECPWVSFKLGGVTYTKSQLDGFTGSNFSGNTRVELIYNGTNGGWNTTTNVIYDDGKLFDWTKKQNGVVVKHAINATYNANLQTGSNYSFIEMNGYEAAVFYQDLNTIGGDVIRWTLNHGIRPTSSAPSQQNISVEIGAPKTNNGEIVTAYGTGSDLHTEIESSSSAKYTKDGVVNGSLNAGSANINELKNLSLSKSSQAGQWYDARGVYVVPKNQSVTRFAFQSDVDNADGNLLDSITFSTLIGNLNAIYNEDKSATVTGYWGETDPSKKLIINIGDNTYELDMSSITGNFKFDIGEDIIGKETYIEVYHEDYEQVKKTVKIVAGKVNKKNLSGTDDLSIVSDDETIINALDENTINKIKHGEDVDISIEINDITDTIEDLEKEVFTDELDKYKLGNIYDVSLYKKLDSDDENIKVTELREPLEFMIKIPQELISNKNERTYKILNYNDGVVEEINAIYDKNTNTLRFKTNNISRFAIIYQDIINPNTGDSYILYLIICIISLSGLIGSSIYKIKID